MNRALGELDHPPPTSPTFRSLNLNNVSHQVLDYHWKGDDLMGFVEVLPTEAGLMLRDLYCAGYQLGVSSRGWATLKERDGFIYIQDDFELITFDFVSDPSTEGAYLRPLQRKYENLQPPIDIKERYRSFMNVNKAAADAAKREAAAAAAAPTPAPAPAPAQVFPPVAMVTGGVKGHGGIESGLTPAAPALVACEGSGGKRDDRREGKEGSANRSSSKVTGEGASNVVLRRLDISSSQDRHGSNNSGNGHNGASASGARGSEMTRRKAPLSPVTPTVGVNMGDTPRGEGNDARAGAGGESGNTTTITSMLFGSSKVSKNKVLPGPPANTSLRKNWEHLQHTRGLVAA